MQWPVILRGIFIVGACGTLSIVQWLNFRWQRSRGGLGFIQMSLILKGLHLGLVAGFIALVLRWPLMGYGNYPSFAVLITEDLINLGLLTGYLFWYLFQLFQWDRTSGRFRSSYRCYLVQYGFFQILLLDVLMLLRLDSFYLPLLHQKYPEVEPLCFELATVLFFVGIQGVALLVRGVKMKEAPPDIQLIVSDVAGIFGFKVHRVKVWQLELVGNAFATGLVRRSIFFTESLLKYCHPDDLRMIVGHECAHFKQHHLEIRVAYIAGWVWMGSLIMEKYPDLNWIYILIYSILGFFIFNVLARFQEIQADLMAAKKLEGGARMAEALVRTFGMGGISGQFAWLFRWMIMHPEMETRVRKLRGM